MLAEKLNVVNDGEESTESCWSVMKTSLLSDAEEVVGYGGRVQYHSSTTSYSHLSKHLLELKYSLIKGAWHAFCLRAFTPLISNYSSVSKYLFVCECDVALEWYRTT